MKSYRKSFNGIFNEIRSCSVNSSSLEKSDLRAFWLHSFFYTLLLILGDEDRQGF